MPEHPAFGTVHSKKKNLSISFCQPQHLNEVGEGSVTKVSLGGTFQSHLVITKRNYMVVLEGFVVEFVSWLTTSQQSNDARVCTY